MFLKGSRYEKARAFKPRADGSDVFAGVRPRQIDPAPGVVEHTVRAGDRLDLLARHYYNDDRLWWRIVDANPEFLHGGDAVQEKDDTGPDDELRIRGMEGQVILIPKAVE